MAAQVARADQMAASPAFCHLPLAGPLDLGVVADSVAAEPHLEDRAALAEAALGAAEVLAVGAEDSPKADYLAEEVVEAAAGEEVAEEEDALGARR